VEQFSTSRDRLRRKGGDRVGMDTAKAQREGSVQLSNCPTQPKGEHELPSVRDRIGSFPSHVGKGTSLLVPYSPTNLTGFSR
jgi:hypothetical protein